jgi:hypothetical protein
MSEVITYARQADAWMKAGGREQVAAAMRGGGAQPPSPAKRLAA